MSPTPNPMSLYHFTKVEDLKFLVQKKSSAKGPWFCVSVFDELGRQLTPCIGSGITIDQAKAAAIGNLVKAVEKITQAEVEAE